MYNIVSAFKYPDPNSNFHSAILAVAETFLRNPPPHLGFYPCLPFGNKVPILNVQQRQYDVMTQQGILIFFHQHDQFFLFINWTDFRSVLLWCWIFQKLRNRGDLQQKKLVKNNLKTFINRWSCSLSSRGYKIPVVNTLTSPYFVLSETMRQGYCKGSYFGTRCVHKHVH